MKEDKKRRQRNKKPQKTQISLLPKHSTKHHKNTHQQKNHAHQSSSSSSLKSPNSKPSSFLDKMKARLSGGHFRMLNEKLYTCTGKEALDYFKEDPDLFDTYHTGYQEQMSHWPELPVNIIMKWLKERSSSLVVADFGCGDARLAKNVKNKVFSIDLVSNEPSVIACDMSSTPLLSSSLDVAVFCLSLMGTNYASYLREACRVLKPSGWLLIAEVKSRFDPNNGGADPNMFCKAVCEMGFTSALKVYKSSSNSTYFNDLVRLTTDQYCYIKFCYGVVVAMLTWLLDIGLPYNISIYYNGSIGVMWYKDFSNKMFVLLYFKKKEKQSSSGGEIEWPELKPCIYKRR